MTDRPKQDLREISHLFLSGIRERQTAGAARPQRIGPGARGEQAVEITPEEMARVTAAGGLATPAPTACVTAVLASHFEEQQSERVRQFAANAAMSCQRVGLIEAESHDFRVWIYERAPDGPATERPTLPAPEPIDARRIAESLEELSCDVDQWFISFGQSSRAPEARELLRRAGRFVLLSACEPDAIVAAYRTLKGTSDIVRRDARPPLSLALFNATDAAHASVTFEKINGVAVQFLNWHASGEMVVDPGAAADEHIVLNFRSAADKSQPINAPHWQLVNDLFDRLEESQTEQGVPVSHPRATEPAADAPLKQPPAPRVAPTTTAMPSPQRLPAIKMSTMPLDDVEEIVELTGGDDAASVLSAVIAGSPQQWLECPLRAPMCDEARLVVSRDRVLTLLAVANKGLSELRSIGQAYQWLSQNRALISMALPQLSIDGHQLPQLQLLVDHADATADMLQPMLHTGHVTVTAYRKVRFSGRRGLLLEAA